MMMEPSIKGKLRNFEHCSYFKSALNRKQHKSKEREVPLVSFCEASRTLTDVKETSHMHS